ncbi:MAG TPA: 2-amino-4-hydroxy-6-hydroxymethyldihydropteridine diphosphokinase [Gemmatimonadaceae bacterium]|nr:2-amino-4-hydroxy-6-hydroxymethyldihydropteridine diphosphokinase [Gemmatimonadaceae bacterium]
MAEPAAPRERVAYIALGSNLGDRAAHLALARRRLAAMPGCRFLRASRIEETAPLGPVPQGAYLNQMVSVATTLSSDALLELLHAIEREAGRERRVRWGPRTLDLDIVLVEGEARSDDRLVLPHPGLQDRGFWQRELEELRSVATSPTAGHQTAPAIELPAWAVVSEKRRAHIARVTALLGEWADAMGLDEAERREWRDAGLLHDALRDADEATLRALVPDSEYTLPMLHGPAAAAHLEADGERRNALLEAIRYHTVGSATWARTGRALYMADYLEPGRRFAQAERAELAARVPGDFDDVFRTVVRQRIEWAVREGKSLYPECVAMWNAVR